MLHLCMSTALIQLQWRVKDFAVAEDTNIQYFTIAFWNHLKYLNYLYAALFPILFCLRLLCCVLMFLCCLLSSVWLIQGLFFFRSTGEKKAHAQSSFNICWNPCSSCRQNGSYFWYRPLPLPLSALNAAIQTCWCLTPTCPFNANAFISRHTNG